MVDPDSNHAGLAGGHTVNLNSFDAFTDCPTREQRAWVGDSVVHQMVHLATNLDWRLAWQYLNLGNSPRSDGILPMSVAEDIEAGATMTRSVSAGDGARTSTVGAARSPRTWSFTPWA